MRLKLTLEQNSGSEVTSLVIPLPASYFLLTDEQIASRFVTPYLESLKTYSLELLAGYSRVNQDNGEETAWSTLN